ncbi:CAP domain-containing protein [candidate division WWE3 bacterium]|nr:CAP domain-containing protein [candidate division WWE3 bacterium]
MMITPTYNTGSHIIEKYQFLHHFLPHPDTKKRAKLLQHNAMATYALVLVLFIGVFRITPRFAPGILGYSSDISVSDLLKSTNKYRNENGLKTLRLNTALTKAAESKARHMFAQNYWAHVAPDGTTPWDFILESKYDYSYAGENLAKNFDSSNDVVKAWINSPSHRENLLGANYDEIGFAVVNGILDGYETTLVVQMFGKPRASIPIASEEEETKLLTAYESKSVVEAPSTQSANYPVLEKPSLSFVPSRSEEVLPAVDVTTASKSITLVVSAFLFILLALDVWYTKRKAIPRLSGNVFAHITFLVMTVVGVWFALTPGIVL